MAGDAPAGDRDAAPAELMAQAVGVVKGHEMSDDTSDDKAPVSKKPAAAPVAEESAPPAVKEEALAELAGESQGPAPQEVEALRKFENEPPKAFADAKQFLPSQNIDLSALTGDQLKDIIGEKRLGDLYSTYGYALKTTA
eukprot:6070894-Pyramimonas_sp.AAC.1